MEQALFEIWTLVTVTISDDDKHYALSVFLQYLF